MDGCSSWLLFHGRDDGTESGRSYSSAGGLHEEKDEALSLQLQQQLKQIYMLMDTEAEAVPASSSSSTFPSSGSPDENSSLMLIGSTTTTTSCHQPVEVSSLQIPRLSPIAYDDYHGLFYGNLDTILDLDDLMTQEPHLEQAKNKYGQESGGAFRPYVRHLSPRKKPKPGARGQRAIKAAMSALARMHEARLAQWESYRMEMAAPPSVGSNSNQVQHVMSERKRREKLNDSFKDLRTVLPPGPKKDWASTLIRARDYVNTLKSRVSELEENRMLVESQLHHEDNGSEQHDYPREQIDVDTTNAAAEETSHEFRLKIVVGSAWNAIDAVVTILQCLNEIEDVRLVGMDTGSRSGDLPPGKDLQIATVTLQVTV